MHKPTAVVVLMEGGAVLLGRSAKSSAISPVPKGGIERRESLLRAARREGKEELRVVKRRFRFERMVGYCASDVEPWRRKPGYSRGKRYYILVATLLGGRKKIRVRRKEIAEVRWVTSIEQFEEFSSMMLPLERLRLWLMLRHAGVPWAVADDLQSTETKVSLAA